MELSSNPKRTYVLKSKELPELDLPSSSYALETVLNGEAYYSRLRLDKGWRPTSVTKLAPWGLEPKPWSEVAKDLYYHNEVLFLKEKTTEEQEN